MRGVATGDMGISKEGEQKAASPPATNCSASTPFSQKAAEVIWQAVDQQFDLNADSGTQHYAIGLKELWTIDPAKHKPGKVMHSIGWPLDHMPGGATGGSFLYHLPDNRVARADCRPQLQNPHLSPFDEMQRWKHHPLIADVLEGGERVSYGARAISKGGLQALSKLTARRSACR